MKNRVVVNIGSKVIHKASGCESTIEDIRPFYDELNNEEVTLYKLGGSWRNEEDLLTRYYFFERVCYAN